MYYIFCDEKKSQNQKKKNPAEAHHLVVGIFLSFHGSIGQNKYFLRLNISCWVKGTGITILHFWMRESAQCVCIDWVCFCKISF